MTNNTNQVKSNQKRNFIVLTIIVGIGVFGLIYLLSDHQAKETAEKSDTIKFVNPLDHIDAESIVLEKTQKELREAKKQTDKLTEKYNSLTEGEKKEEESTQKINQDLMTRISTLEKQISAMQVNNSATNQMQGSNAFQDGFLPAAGSAQPGQPNISSHGIREDALSLTQKDSEQEKKPLKNPDTYVPAGAFARAVMLSGADASAAVNSQANPEPMVFQIIDNGKLPNKTTSHLKGCLVTVATIGDISSERGKMRTERLSCTFDNGETVEQEIEGTIVGPEGKNGVRGNVREGGFQNAAYAAGSGFLSGFSNGLSQRNTTTSTSPEGSVSTVIPARALQNGFNNASEKGLDKLSDYEMKKAEQYHPVIQLSAGTVVDVLFLKGFFLDGKKHENADKTVGNYTEQPNTSSLFPSQPTDAQTLPLSDENVRRIQERSKELGLRVTPNVS